MVASFPSLSADHLFTLPPLFTFTVLIVLFIWMFELPLHDVSLIFFMFPAKPLGC